MRQANMGRTGSGFTLIELMIVVVVAAILAVIAISAYSEQVRKSRRAEAVQALSDLQLRQEQFRADNPTYGTLDDLTGSAAASAAYNNSLKNYNVVVSGTSGAGYTLTANRKNAMTNDPKCGNFILTLNSGSTTKSVSQGDSSYCWRE
jgi:type IV pilus assembly protein PilE